MYVTFSKSQQLEPHQVFDNYAVTVMIGDDPYTLGLFDTAGTHPCTVSDFSDLPVHYPQVRRIMIDFVHYHTRRQTFSSFVSV